MNGKFLGTVSFLIAQSVASVCFADNPIVQTIYTADPAPMVHDGAFYVYTGHDEDGAGWFDMREWRVFSTTDMVNWTDLGSPMSLQTFSWANVDAWAAQCVYRNGNFYYYVPIRLDGDWFGIGVGVSDKPEGPFIDAIGAPLLEGNAYIDPTVFVDDDGQAYLYWGNGHLWMARLNEDMISISGDVTDMPLTRETVDNTFGEGPWLYKRDGLYYLLFASLSEFAPNVGRDMENIRYSTSLSPIGPWEYRGMIMPSEGGSWTNHPGVADYKGNSYFVYHNAALPGGGDGQRSVCVEQFEYNDDGTIPEITMTTEGPDPLGTLNPFERTEAETIAWESGVETEACSEGGVNVTDIHDGDYIKVREVDFRAGAESFSARVAGNGGNIELHLDSEAGTVVGICTIEQTDGAQTWQTQSCPVSGATGKHDLFLRFAGGEGSLFNFNWWKFEGPGDPATGGSGGAGNEAGEGGREATGGVLGTGGSGGTGNDAGEGGRGGRETTGGVSGTGGGGVVGTGGTGGSGATAGTSGLGGSQSGGTSGTGGATVGETGGTTAGETGGATVGPAGGSPWTATGGIGAGATTGGSTAAGPAGTDSSPDKGCGCRLAGGRSSSSLLAAFGLGVLVLRPLRRRARRRTLKV